jgi:hypothetical protein
MKVVLFALLSLSAFAQGKPETVMVTYHAKDGSAAALARTLARHWTTVRDLKLVADERRLLVRGAGEGGRIYFVEIFTWRDASIPDDPPAAVRAIWDDLNRYADKIEIVEVEIVGDPPARAAAASGSPAPSFPALFPPRGILGKP